MDPQANLNFILAELSATNPDRDRVVELLDSLSSWIGRGGFLPIVERIEDGEDPNRVAQFDVPRSVLIR